MTKITFIGAGSLGFTSELVRDILTFPLLEDATISLMDIHPERLAWAKKGIEKLIAAGSRPAKVEATLDRAEALKGADVVLTTILAGSTEGDPTMVYRAIAHDPLTAAVLSLAEIKEMTNELFAQHKDYLPQFKHHVA